MPAVLGRVYTTTAKLYFLSSDGKHFSIPWTDVLSIDKGKSFMKASDNVIVVTYTSADGDNSIVLSQLESRDDFLNHTKELLLPWTKPILLPVPKKLDAVAPDSKLEKMTIALTKPLKGVSVQQVYEKVWSEGVR